jgi:hypothetical protein
MVAGSIGTDFFFGQWQPSSSAFRVQCCDFLDDGAATELSDMLMSWLLMLVKKEVAADEVHTELSKLNVITSGSLPLLAAAAGISMWNDFSLLAGLCCSN